MFTLSQVTPCPQCVARWIRDCAAAQDVALALCPPCLALLVSLILFCLAWPSLVLPSLAGRSPSPAPLACCPSRPRRRSVVVKAGSAESHYGCRLRQVRAGRRRQRPRGAPCPPRPPHSWRSARRRGDPRGSAATEFYLSLGLFLPPGVVSSPPEDWVALPSRTGLKKLQQRRVSSWALANANARSA